MRKRAAAALGHWLLIGSAGLAGTLAFVAARASRSGCVESSLADLIAVAGLAGFGLSLATLLLVGAVSRYRTAIPVLATLSALGLSIYALVSFLAHDSGTCF